jgi:hypothetical protein
MASMLGNDPISKVILDMREDLMVVTFFRIFVKEGKVPKIYKSEAPSYLTRLTKLGLFHEHKNKRILSKLGLEVAEYMNLKISKKLRKRRFL